MSQTIYIKDYDTEITIPDGADMAQVEAALRRQFPSKNAAAPAEQQMPQRAPLTFAGVLSDPFKINPSVLRPALEVGGALAGATLAAPGNVLAPGLASLAGAGLGYAGGRQIANALEERAGTRPVATLPQALASTAMAIPEGAAMEAGGAVIGKGIAAGLKAAGKWAPRIYNSVAKFSKPQNVTTAIENRIPVTEKGLKKAENIFDKLNNEISGIISRGEKSGATIKTSDILKSLDRVKQKIRDTYANPTALLKEVDEYAGDFVAGRGESIPVQAVQKLKQGIQSRMSKYYRDPTAVVQPRNISPGIFVESEKAIGHGLREQLVEMFPELARLNQKDAAMINLLKELPRAIGRIERRDVAQLPELIAAGAGAAGAGPGGWLAGIGMKLLRVPSIMSRLAFALDKASKIGGAPTASKAVGYGAAKIGAGGRERLSGGLASAIGSLDPANSAEAAEIPGAASVRQAMQSYLDGDYQGTVLALRRAARENPAKADDYLFEVKQVIREQNALRRRGKAN